MPPNLAPLSHKGHHPTAWRNPDKLQSSSSWITQKITPLVWSLSSCIHSWCIVNFVRNLKTLHLQNKILQAISTSEDFLVCGMSSPYQVGSLRMNHYQATLEISMVSFWKIFWSFHTSMLQMFIHLYPSLIFLTIILNSWLTDLLSVEHQVSLIKFNFITA